MTHAAPLSPPAAPPLTTRQFLAPLAATLAVCALLVTWTAGLPPIIGDEAHHYHKALCFYETPWSWSAPWFGIRLDHDPAYPMAGETGMRYWDASLWPMGLATIWKIIGWPSPLAAQLYQAAFLLMLGLLAFLTGRALYGSAGGWWTWALVMSLPLNFLFGMTFYLELPAAAMCALAVYALLRRRPLWLAVGLAGMFYMKEPSAAVLAGPLALAALFRLGDTWPQRLGRTALALGAALVLLWPDLAWRTAHFGRPLIFSENLPPVLHWLDSQVLPTQQGAIPMSILDPVMAVGTLGLPGLAALAAAVVWGGWLLGRAALGLARRLLCAARRRPAPEPEELSAELLVAAWPLFAFIVAFIVMLHRAPDVRYFYPAMFFVCLLGGGLLTRADPLGRLGPRRRWVRAGAALLLLAMVGQLLTVPYIVRQRRTLPPSVVAGFDWIRGHTPPNARIFYPEFNLLTLTGRPIIWSAIMPQYFFTVSESQQARLLCHLDVKYIAVPPNRFVDTVTPTVAPLGYPRAWAGTLSGRPYLERVFPDHPVEPESKEFVLYRVDRDRIPPDWLARPFSDYDRNTPEGRPGGP
jgi:hypothetical protein